jgi:hypothetical protein
MSRWRSARRSVRAPQVTIQPDHSTVSRTRRLIDLETHQAVFTWVLQRLADAGLVKGKTIGVDATTLEVNAALRSIVRRDTGESYEHLFWARRCCAKMRAPLIISALNSGQRC